MAKTNSNKANPALERLEIFLGDWEMELSNSAFLPHPSNTLQGQISFEWVEDGAFLRMCMGDDAIWLISRDDSNPDYEVFYYDSRNVSRVYKMSFSEGTWKMWRISPNFSQRYEGKMDKDGNIISGKWEKSTDGREWEHDFNVTYTRRK